MAQALIDFKDAVNAENLDPSATVAVYYADGPEANEAAVRARCPHARLFGITTLGQTGKGIFACDSETGDLTVAQTEQWVVEQIALGVDPLAVYANENRWINLGLLAALARYGKRIKRWDADWTGEPASMPEWADADQYLGGNVVDLDVARAEFFEPSIAPKPATPHGTVRFEGTADMDGKVLTIRGLPDSDAHFAGAERWVDLTGAQLNTGAHGPHWRRG